MLLHLTMVTNEHKSKPQHAKRKPVKKDTHALAVRTIGLKSDHEMLGYHAKLTALREGAGRGQPDSSDDRVAFQRGHCAAWHRRSRTQEGLSSRRSTNKAEYDFRICNISGLLNDKDDGTNI